MCGRGKKGGAFARLKGALLLGTLVVERKSERLLQRNPDRPESLCFSPLRWTTQLRTHPSQNRLFRSFSLLREKQVSKTDSIVTRSLGCALPALGFGLRITGPPRPD